MKAKRIVLVGFDGGSINGKYNFHDHYAPGRGGHKFYRIRWNPEFRELEFVRRHRYADVEIINCSPMTSIKAFKYRDLEEVLDSEDSNSIENWWMLQSESCEAALFAD